MKLLESEKSNSKSKSPSAKWPRFVICVENKGNEVSLEVGRIYRWVKPRPKDQRMAAWIRVIDESGEDYLFPAKRFVEVTVPNESKRAVTRASAPSCAL